MSANQNSLNSNELEGNIGDLPTAIRKDSADNARNTVGQSDSNLTTTTNNQNIIVNGNNNLSSNIFLCQFLFPKFFKCFLFYL